jgi:ATP-dependent Lhr-like helicase
VFRALLQRERLSIPWRDLLRALRLLELAGRVHGGRFVDGYSGEQFALPEAIPLLRKAAEADFSDLELDAADPLSLKGQLVPGRVVLES